MNHLNRHNITIRTIEHLMNRDDQRAYDAEGLALELADLLPRRARHRMRVLIADRMTERRD